MELTVWEACKGGVRVRNPDWKWTEKTRKNAWNREEIIENPNLTIKSEGIRKGKLREVRS